MANQEQLVIWAKGVEVWNKWREENPAMIIDLSNSHLGKQIKIKLNFGSSEAVHTLGDKLGGVNLDNTNLGGAILTKVDLSKASFCGANLTGAIIDDVDLTDANLSSVNLDGANLMRANLTNTNLNKAKITNAKLDGAQFIGTFVEGANISGSSVYAVNVWDVKGEFEEQKDLVITREGEPIITVDNIKIAQFIYLILNHEQIRDVINTLTSKSVLILGRFSIPERKGILDVLRDELRKYDLLPIVFDFDRPTDKDFTETIKTLAGLSYFVIADITNPKSSPLELQATVPDYQIPFVPIIQEGESPFAMMIDLQKKYNWVLNTVTYDSMETLIKVLRPLIIDPAMKKRNELRLIKAQVPEVISGKDFLEKGKA
ncbi:MAG: pentapeptide repeat-containing protein [Chloroflexota bacterium]